MPCCEFINVFPSWFFLLVHLALFLVGAVLAARLFRGEAPLLGWGFTLFAIAELSYMTYHLDWTLFLLAHTVSEVLLGVAFVTIFVGAARSGIAASPAASAAGTR